MMGRENSFFPNMQTLNLQKKINKINKIQVQKLSTTLQTISIQYNTLSTAFLTLSGLLAVTYA